jgi:hypothetical protein
MLAVFPACDGTYVEKITPEAQLLSLKIGDLVLRGDSLPAPVTHVSWDDEEYDLYRAEFKTLSFNRESEIENRYFEPTVSAGAKVKWGVANRTVRPNYFYDTRVPATFDARDFLYFQVTSEDGTVSNYYRFATYVSSPVKELSSIKVAGIEGDMNTVAPDETWNGELIAVGGLHVTKNKAASAEIDAVPWADTSSLRYAVTTNLRFEPVFEDNSTLSFNDGDYLYVEVTAENTDKNIYCFRVYVGRIATISKLTFKTPTKGDFEALGKGTAKNEWRDNTGAGSFDSPHQPPAGYTFAVELDEVEGTWQYAKLTRLPTNNTQAASLWTTPASNDATPTVRLEHGEYLAIKVIPPNRAAASPDYFYKVKIGNLAAEFTVQPKSAVYQKDAAAAPLSFTLDRTITGATYQWYEANSWYGGYGFDSAGLIGTSKSHGSEAGWGGEDKGVLHKDGTMTFYDRDTDLPDLDPDVDEFAYDVTKWHVENLDEKENVSLHNGGNQYYRLPTPGRPIPASQGGTAQSYQPKTNYRPFITNFSNESHYYWVVVTDPATGLKATSARAVVVTEWGIQYHDGEPAKDTAGNIITVNKKHYIIDLYAYQTPGATGLQASPRNPTPFKAGNHGDSYWIPVTFPAGFDIYDYSVFTAQALFFLADGREWIQNWTQGDIGFGRKARDEDGELIPGADPEEIVLWYNLTNDNATRGLASSGNEPQGGGLVVIPDYIVVKPAGTKKINLMPPFSTTLDSVGRPEPQNTNDAQGWFTPYIELCELRFEGPAREKPAE